MKIINKKQAIWNKGRTIKILLFFVFPVSCLLLLIAQPVSAATIFFGTKSHDVSISSNFEVGVFLDSQAQSVNAIEGQILFPKGAFQLQGFYTGNSMLNFWIQQPALASPGVISFSGIAPGGFAGPKGYLFSFILKPSQKGNAVISAANEKILLNDGIASEAPIAKAPLTINVVASPLNQAFVPLADTTPPEAFEPNIGKEADIFNGKYFLAFATQDKASGIDHYQVMEAGQFGSFASLFSKSTWQIAQSPYLLQDQTLQSVIYVKAVDRAGNERVVKMAGQNGLPWYQNYFIWSIIAIIGGIFIVRNLWKKIIKH